jgi:hypothetical protein
MNKMLLRKELLRPYRSFSLESFKKATFEKVYAVKMFFKWISFHSKKYIQEIKEEHSAGLPDPPDYVPPKRLSIKEYIFDIFIPTVQFVWKHKTKSMKVMEEEYFKIRDPKVLKELRQKGYEFTELEYYFELDYEKEELKEKEKLQGMTQVQEPKVKRIKEYKHEETKDGGGDEVSTFQKYFKFFIEIFFNSLRQFILGKE